VEERCRPAGYRGGVDNREGKALGVEAARWLRDRKHGNTELTPGLSTEEFDRVEQRFGFHFADDHRAFLEVALPIGGSWPDWRGGDWDALAKMLDWPVEGALFDVEHNGEWHETWSAQPADPAEARALAASYLATWPQMVPVRSHRYLPAGRGTHGHPVLSMVQLDIISYGDNLADYLENELNSTYNVTDPAELMVPLVPFWSDYL
jgi:hypothetical protein